MQEARSKQTNIDLEEHRFKHGVSKDGITRDGSKRIGK